MSKSPNAVAAQQAITDFIGQIRSNPEGQPMKLSVIRANAQAPIDVTVQPTRGTDDGPQSIGVLLRPNFVKTEAIRSDSIPQAISLAASSVAELTTETANGLLKFFGQIASGKGAPPGQGVSGPIGLIRTGSSVVSTSDLTAILTFAAAISVNLAVVNSLPLPALDGGQMLFVISEALTGRKVDQRLQEGINSVALIFLLLLSFGTTIGDVESLFGR
jgi:RIP metalloprotease RseP